MRSKQATTRKVKKGFVAVNGSFAMRVWLDEWSSIDVLKWRHKDWANLTMRQFREAKKESADARRKNVQATRQDERIIRQDLWAWPNKK